MGMNGVGGSMSMPRNCGMAGMHGNNQAKKPTEAAQQNASKVSDPRLGNKIDEKI